MSHKIELRLETFVCGLFIIQPQYDETDFENLIGEFLAPHIKKLFTSSYRELEGCKGGCFCRDDQCSSSDNLRLIRHFEKGGSGSSGLEFKRPAVDAASGGLR